MKNKLPSLAALLLAILAVTASGQTPPGQPQPSQPQPPPNQPPGGAAAAATDGPQGDALLDHVVANLEAAPSISAKIRHRVELMGRPLIGTGTYAQQGRGAGRQFRLELQLRTSLSATAVDYVCDGEQLWLFDEFDNKKTLSTVDVARLRRAKPKSDAQPPAPNWWIALGGLPKLMSNLKESFQFGEVVASKLDELSVWSVEGRWRPDRLAQFLPEQGDAIRAGQGADLSKLTPNIPHRVVLHVGYDDLFPYRIEYWRTETDEEGKSTGHEQLMTVLECYEVRFAAPIEASRFAFRPPEKVKPVDRTQEWLDRLGLQDPPPLEATRTLRSRL